LAGVALTIPVARYFQVTLAFLWLLAFSSATHDIAADGFYMLALTEKEQAFFVGIRSTFYRIATIGGQGLLVILAGIIQSNTGLPKVELQVEAAPGAAWTSKFEPPSGLAETGSSGNPQFVFTRATNQISPETRDAAEVKALVASARDWNQTHGFNREASGAKAGDKAKKPTLWGTYVSGPLGRLLQQHFGRETKAAGQGIAGNIGIAWLSLTADPKKVTIATLAMKSGDKSISVLDGVRLVFDSTNWKTPAAVLVQLDPKLKTSASAVFELRSGNIGLSWVVVFGVLVALFLGFGTYHRFVLPYAEKDRAGTTQSVVGFLKEFFKTFGAYFSKNRIGILLLFLLFYRFAEAQLVKMVTPFLLDGREVGGLGLTTGQVGFVYGTVGIIALTCGGLLGGMVASKWGLRAWLWPMVFIMHLPDAVFVYLAYAQPGNFALINLCVAIEQFGYGFGFTAYMLYMIYLARGQHQTAHYAICTGFMALGMMLPGMFSGWLQEIIGYQHFFVWVVLATIPGFLIVAFVPLDAGFGKKASRDP
jgi:PAT family beta-lactamase induction signal transducer AmpG